MANDDFHPQKKARVILGDGGVEEFPVDSKLAPLVEALNAIHIQTYESCENYGEYLRHFGDLEHVFESKRDYAYVEFYSTEDALEFVQIVKDNSRNTPLYFRLVHGGTPDAWEVKINLAADERTWVWFPIYDIEEVTQIVQAAREDW